MLSWCGKGKLHVDKMTFYRYHIIYGRMWCCALIRYRNAICDGDVSKTFQFACFVWSSSSFQFNAIRTNRSRRYIAACVHSQQTEFWVCTEIWCESTHSSFHLLPTGQQTLDSQRTSVNVVVSPVTKAIYLFVFTKVILLRFLLLFIVVADVFVYFEE